MEAQQQNEMIRTRLYPGSSEAKKSLKTTVPLAYVELCGITSKDELEWTHEKINGECILRVKVVKSKK